MKFQLVLIFTIALLIWSPEAKASDPSGLVYVLAIVGIGFPFLVGSTIFTISGCLKGRYELRAHAVNHVIVSTAFLTLGILAFLAGILSGPANFPETAVFAGILIGIPTIFIIAPWLLHIRQRKGSEQSQQGRIES